MYMIHFMCNFHRLKLRSTSLENKTLHCLKETFLYYSKSFTFLNNSHERRLFFLIQQIKTVEFSLEVVISLPQASLPRASWELLAATRLRMDECHRARPRAHAPFSWSSHFHPSDMRSNHDIWLSSVNQCLKL